MLRSKFLKSTSGLFLRYSSTKALKGSRKIGSGGYALLAVPVATFALGTWQVQRRSWKLDLIEQLQKRTNAPTVDLPYDLEELSQLEYRKIHVRGKFDHSKEIYIGPRSLITEKGDGEGRIFSSKPQSGYWVITPFELADRDLTILVNRGWVPRKKMSAEKRAEGQIEDEVDLVGIVRLTEKRQPFMSKNRPDTQLFSYRDIEAMAEKCGTSPVFLDATVDSSVPGGPIGGQTRVALRNEHLSYIFTWYSLCVVTLYLWYKKFFKGVKFV